MNVLRACYDCKYFLIDRLSSLVKSPKIRMVNIESKINTLSISTARGRPGTWWWGESVGTPMRGMMQEGRVAPFLYDLMSNFI